jgi:hypothetical protein
MPRIKIKILKDKDDASCAHVSDKSLFLFLLSLQRTSIFTILYIIIKATR